MNRFERVYIVPTKRLLDRLDFVLSHLGDEDLCSIFPDYQALELVLNYLVVEESAEKLKSNTYRELVEGIEAAAYGLDMTDCCSIADELIHVTREYLLDHGFFLRDFEYKLKWEWVIKGRGKRKPMYSRGFLIYLNLN